MEGFFPQNPRPVEPSPAAKGDAHAADTAHQHEAAKAAESARETGRHAGKKRERAPLTGDAAYYRSARLLSAAIIASQVLMTAGVIVVALILTSSQERLVEVVAVANQTLTTELQRANANTERAHAIAERANASAEQANAMWKESADKFAKLEERLERREAAHEASLKVVWEKLAGQRPAGVSPQLSSRERNTFVRNLAAISAKVKDKADKRAVDALRQKFLNGEYRDRLTAIKDYAEVLSGLDGPIKVRMEETVGNPLVMGE